jgi:hypothetical protein
VRPGVKSDAVLAEFDHELAALRDHPVGDKELQKAKNLEQAGFVFGQDSIFREAMLLGLYQMLGNYRMIDQYLPQIDKVTAADVQRVAREYLIASNSTVGVLVPTGVLPHEMSGGAAGQIHHAPVANPATLSPRTSAAPASPIAFAPVRANAANAILTATEAVR